MLYVSSSIEDILGHTPHDVVGKSCWEFFHPDEIPFAQSIHGRSIHLDKAAVLNYCQIKNKHGRWVGCECVFTIVHDVLVASTSIYRSGPGSQSLFRIIHFLRHLLTRLQGRAIEAPVIRQLFSSSPRDPRYHMLSYISHKFSQDIPTHVNEPRAALFLNRFSRTLAIMYATNGLADVLGIPSDQLIGRSFYYCIQENCLREAVKCLESAKANDSIAYLRFWFRDPTHDQEPDPDEHMSDGQSTADEDEGGVHLSELITQDRNEEPPLTGDSVSLRSSAEPTSNHSRSNDPSSRSPSGNSTDLDGNTNDTLFDQSAGFQSSTSSLSVPDEAQAQRQPWRHERPRIELEAVVSCTSDGLVVVLRAARPLMPQVSQALQEPTKPRYANGFFAVPWASNPILPDQAKRSRPLPDSVRPARFPPNPTAVQANTAAVGGPSSEDFMNSIREVAVFAWSLVGINGSLAKYGRGIPCGEAQPPNGLRVWDPYSNAGPERPLAIERAPNTFQYSPIDGTPIYDRMDIDDEVRHDPISRRTTQHPYTTTAPTNGFYNPATGLKAGGARQNGAPSGSEQSSQHKDVTSVFDFADASLRQSNTARKQIGSVLQDEQRVPFSTGQQMSDCKNMAPDSQDQNHGCDGQGSLGANPERFDSGSVDKNGSNGYAPHNQSSVYDPFAPDRYAPPSNTNDASPAAPTPQPPHYQSTTSPWNAADTRSQQTVHGSSRWT